MLYVKTGEKYREVALFLLHTGPVEPEVGLGHIGEVSQAWRS